MADFRRTMLAAALLLAAPALTGTTGRLTSLDARLLAAHNRERSAARLPAMAWDPALAAEAEAWARRLAASGDLEHSDGDEEGENLWLGTKGAYAPEQMVGLWIEEKANYRPGPIPAVSRTGDFEDVGHYTQLMWRDTDRVGCALAAGREDEVLVCRYRQPGNVEGERAF